MSNDFNKLCMSCMQPKGEKPICHYCGFDNSRQNKQGYLPLRSVLQNRYIVGRIIRINGEGATYICFDSILEKVVWIREFYPTVLCSRNEGENNVIVSQGSESTYQELLREFVHLHKTMVKLSSISSVLSTIDMFEENNTFYSVTESFEGITLKEFIRRVGEELNWNDAKRIFLPLLNSLNSLNNANVYHLGISPETILINKHGEVKLIDFCIKDVRIQGGILNAELYNGYAAPEQYEGGVIGSWSDIYAVAAVIYKSLTGIVPPDATLRIKNDTLDYADEINSEIPRAVSTSLSNALRLFIEVRISSFSELIYKICKDDESSKDIPSSQPVKSKSQTKAKNSKDPEEKKQKSYSILISVASVVVVLVIGLTIFAVIFEDKIKNTFNKEPSSSVSDSATSSSEVESNSSSEAVSYGKLENYVGLPYKDIEKELKEKHKIKYEEVYNEDYEQGIIFEQSPKAYTSLDKVKELVIKVSKGAESIDMPDIEGKTIEEVRQTLFDKKIKFEEVIVVGTNYPNGVVVRADRDAKDKIYIKKDNITIFVSGERK